MTKDKHVEISLNFLIVAAFLGQMTVGAVGIAVPIYANLLGASPFLLGTIGAAGGLLYSFMPLISGILSDRLKKKVFISASMISYGFSSLLYMVVDDPLMLMPIKALEWASVSAFWPTLEASLAETSEGNLEGALKKYNISWGLAMIIGPMVGGFMISSYTIKTPFLLSLATAIPLGVLSIILVREPPRRRERETKEDSTQRGRLNSRYLIITVLSSIFLFSSINGIIASLFPAYATDLGIPAYEIGLIMFANGAARTVAFYLADRIEAKATRIGMFLIGSSTLAVGSALTVNSYTTLTFLVCFLIFGFGAGVSYAASISLILGRWGSSRGFAAGVFESLIGLGYFVGPLIGGAVSEYALNAPYIYGFVLSMTVFFIQLAVNKRSLSFSRLERKRPDFLDGNE